MTIIDEIKRIDRVLREHNLRIIDIVNSMAVKGTEPLLIFDSEFDELNLGNINGQGAYPYAGTWVNDSGADCTAEIIADPGNGKMLRLDDQSGANYAGAYIDLIAGAELLSGIIEVKGKVDVLEANSRGYFWISDADIANTGQGAFFRGDSSQIYYRTASGAAGNLQNCVVDTWYVTRMYFCRLANYAVWWVDDVFRKPRLSMGAGDNFERIFCGTRDIHSGCKFDVKYFKVWSLHYVT